MSLLGVLTLAVGIYLPALRGMAIWDDEPLIFGKGSFGTQSLLDAFTKPFGNYYRPLTSASFALEKMYAHGNTFFYHADNIILHGITSLLICYLVLLLTQRKLAGILAGLFFAAQPMQVGAVAWIGGRTDVLSVFFLTAFLISLVRYHKTPHKGWLAASVLLYFLAALTKEQASAMLPAVPLSVFVFGTKKWRDALRLTAPFVVILMIYVALWRIGAPLPRTASNSLSYTIMLAMRTAAHYGLAFLAPNKPSLITFTLENYRSFFWIPLGASIVVGVLVFLRWAWKAYPELAWITICGLLVYLPISNCPTVPSLVVGPFRCAQAGIGCACLFGISTAFLYSSKKFLVPALLGVNFLAGTLVTWWGVNQWITPQGFFSRVVSNDPHFIVGVEFDAHYLDDGGHPAEAAKVTSDVLAWLFATEHWPELLDIEKTAAVTPALKQRLRSNSGIPNVPMLSNFIAANALALAHQGKIGQAALVAKDALAFAPNDTWVNFLYGRLIFKRNRSEAISHWELAMRVDPNYSECAIALGHVRLMDHRYQDAANLLKVGLEQFGNNGNAWLDLADAKIALHDLKGAAEALDKATSSRRPAAEIDIAKRRELIRAMTGK